MSTDSLTRAAIVLGVSAGALSKSLAVLSDELGFPLYEAAGRGLRLTRQARELLPQIQNILASVDALGTVKPNPLASSKTLRVATFESFSGRLSASLMASLRGEFELEMHELLPSEIEDALLDNVVDVGITYQPIPRKGVRYQKILNARMGVYGSLRFRNREIAELPFVAPLAESSSGMSRAKGLDGWDEVSCRRNVRHRVDLLETGLQLASAGEAVIFIPHFLARAFNQQSIVERRLHLFDLKIPAKMGSQDIFIVSREDDSDSTAVRKMARFIRAECKP